MFYFYGRKKRIAGLYKDPEFDTIIEPFAGSAAYSLHGDRWNRNVIINDTDPTVIGVWRYLLSASKKDILNLPNLNIGDKTTDFSLIKEERDLIGYHINPGSAVPKVTCTLFSRWNTGKQYIAENIHKVKHWKVFLGDYKDLPDIKATYFIDPPYHAAGKHYSRGNTIDYRHLSEWSLSRSGEVIVCEQSGADWLPFSFLTETKNAGNYRCKEVVFYKV